MPKEQFKHEIQKLDAESYEQLRNRVLRRDGWGCQSCGAMSNREVQHKDFRSHCGEDSERNLATLGIACHRSLHELRVEKPGRDFC